MADIANNIPETAFYFPYWDSKAIPYWPDYAPNQSALPAIHDDPVRFVREQLQIEPDSKQLAILQGRHRRLLINCTRQWGKSTITAAVALHRLLKDPGKTVVVLCPVQRQSNIFVAIFKEFVRRLGMRPRGDGENRCSCRLPNGSRIVGLPGRSGDTIRGFTLIMLIVDEAARLTDPVFFSAYPSVSRTQADIWALSTPLGRRGFFYDYWAHGGDEWQRVQAPATECPRIPSEELERARRALGDDWVRQEYLCQFIDIEGAIFDRDRIDAAFASDVTVLGGPEWGG